MSKIRVRNQVSHEKCPTLKIPFNAKEIKCDGATCMTVCKKGFIPKGRRRITCLENEENKGTGIQGPSHTDNINTRHIGTERTGRQWSVFLSLKRII